MPWSERQELRLCLSTGVGLLLFCFFAGGMGVAGWFRHLTGGFMGFVTVFCLSFFRERLM